MKKQIQLLKLKIKEFSFLSALLVLIFTIILSSCNNAKPEDTKEVAEEQNEAKFENEKEEDAEFLVSAAEMNLKEIQLAQLAQTSSQHAEVKKLATKMETEHTKALSDLNALAAKKGITLPTSVTDNGLEANKKLMDKQGKDFDKEYCDRMVSGHKDAISKFEKASTDATDSDIRNWAASMLPILRTHLSHSITCQKLCDKM